MINARRMVCTVVLFIPVWAAAASSSNIDSLEQFIDGVMERSIVAGETVGATVSLVQNGRLLVANGYGLADVERGIPVQARVTQFRIGSISKVLIWISVLQLVEAGQLDLDADVNTYLTDFQLAKDFTDPITLRHLMTHTAGFEDSLINLFVSGPRQVGSLTETLAKEMPRRVRLPGNLVAYSNYGAALAAHIVAQVVTQPWDDYIAAHVLEPLGMTGATTRQPLPEEIDATRAKGYTRSTDEVVEQGFLYVPLAPAGAGTATALDMARLMVELLNPDSTSILSAHSKAQLLGGAYISHPLVNGMTLGLYETTRGGSRSVGHGGNTLLFNSQMVLWPDEGVGLFVSSNTVGDEGVARALVETVAEHLGFVNRTAELQGVLSGTAYTGHYIGGRRNHSNFSKLLGLTDTVRVDFDRIAGKLWVTDTMGRRQYRQVDDGVFQHVGGFDRIVFKGVSEQASELYFSNRPMIGYTRASRAQTIIVNGSLLGMWTVLMAAVLLTWPVSSLTHRQHPHRRGQRLATVLTYASGIVVVVFLVQLASVASGPYELLVGGFARIPPLLWYPAAFALLVLVRVWYLYRVWAEGFWWMSRRLHFTAILFADCGMVWWFWYWNLLPEALLNFSG